MNEKSRAYLVSEEENILSISLDVIDYDRLFTEEYSTILNKLRELNKYVDTIIKRQIK